MQRRGSGRSRLLKLNHTGENACTTKTMLVLASQSPRRREILLQAGIPFTVRAVAVDETPLTGERPEDYVRRIAEHKARAVPADATETVLGADTTVVAGGLMLGK